MYVYHEPDCSSQYLIGESDEHRSPASPQDMRYLQLICTETEDEGSQFSSIADFHNNYYNIMNRRSKSPLSSVPVHKLCLRIQDVVRLKRLARQWKVRIQNRMLRKCQHRLNVIKEWIQTENNYVRDLNIIIHNIKTPMQEKAILTHEQIKIVFANIEGILLLSQRLLQELIRIKDNWNPGTLKISSNLARFYPYLKVYSEYYNNYHQGQNILKEIKHLEDVQQIQKALTMDFESYLIKPIQRPLKYQLLIKEYWICMPKKHPDYDNIQQIIQKYNRVNSENNDELGRKEKTARLIRLGAIYGELLRPNRELLKQFIASTFFVPTVKVYLLTDIILITREENQRQVFEKAIQLDGSRSFVDFKSGKYSHDLTIIVCGHNAAIHLMFSAKNLMLVAYQAIQNVILQLVQRLKTKCEFISKKCSRRDDTKTTIGTPAESKDQSYCPSLKVVCMGVQKRQVSMISNQTYYILKFSINSHVELCQFVYVRFSQMNQLRSLLCEQHPSIVFPELSPNITHYKQISVVDISIDSSHLVAYRMLSISEFLNFVFRCERVMLNPLPVLNILKIEQNLWQYSIEKEPQHCSCSLCSRSPKTITIRQSMHQRYHYIKNCPVLNKQEFCIIKHIRDRIQLLSIASHQFSTLQERLMYLDYFQGRIDYNMVSRKNKSEFPLVIKVHLMRLEHQTIQININESSTVGEVISAICRSIRMFSYQDFGLFIQYESEMRLLDEDQFMFQILNQSEEADNNSFLKKLKHPIKSIKQWSKDIVKYKHSKLYFGKYLFLEASLQKSACQRSTIRYGLIIQQIFYYIHKRLILLSDSEMKRIVALYLCLRLEDQISILNKQNFPYDKVNSLVHSEMVTSKWVSEVINIIETIKRNLIDRPNYSMVIYDRVLEIVQSKIGWKSTLFPVLQYNHNRALYVGINIDGLVVVQKGTNNVVLNIPINLLRYRIVPFSLSVEFNELQCRFEGKLIYNFGKIAEKYIILNQHFKALAPSPESKYSQLNI